MNHINIISFHGVIFKDEQLVMVTEYAENGSLYQLLHENPLESYTEVQALDWISQCAKVNFGNNW